MAKPASQIQAHDSPRYDNVFIMFGPFHIMMAYFSCIGFFLDGSGGEIMMLDAEVLASGSLNGFISGKHYNRNKRLHPLLATAFETLHFTKFIVEYGPIPDSVIAGLANVIEDVTPRDMEDVESADEMLHFLEEYEAFSQLTREGKHGATARYWMIYIDLISVYFLFSRACRTNDVDLFIYSLSLMCPVFFSANKQNYARYMVRFILNLLNMDTTHPGVRQMLEKGALTIRRSSKPFSRLPVDMTLEQTINADAASRLTGISAFQQSDAAKNRWTITRTARSAVVGELLNMAGLKKTSEDVHKELRPSRVRRDNEDLKKLVEGIEASHNPFAENESNNLYCITTGNAVSETVKNDLLNFKEHGERWCSDFRNECLQDPLRFERSIRRKKVMNFASEAVSVKLKSVEMKVVEIKCTRDLFGHLLYMATFL